jgi:hypothetical protein
VPFFIRKWPAHVGPRGARYNTAPGLLAFPIMTLMFTRTKVVVLLLVSLASGCRSAEKRSEPTEARRGEPLILERLQVGSVYGIGSHFESDRIEFAVEGFGEGLGNAEVSRAAEAAAPKSSKKAQAAKTLRLSHATLRCRGRGVNHLEFDFIDSGGPVALEIAGETRKAADFIELDGARLGSVRIAVTEANTAGIRHGRVVVSGATAKFAISGSDLEVVDLRLSRDE